MFKSRFFHLGLAGLLVGGVVLATFLIQGKPVNQSNNEVDKLAHADGNQYAIPDRAARADIKRIEDAIEVLKRSENGFTREMGALRAKVSVLEQEETETRRQLNELAQQRAAFAGENSDSEFGKAADARMSSLLSPEQREAQERAAEAQVQAQFKMLDQKARSEKLDGKWAAAAERQIRDSIVSSNIAGVRLVAAKCRSTVCRMSLSRDATVPPQESIAAVLAVAPWSAPSMAQSADSGEVVVYLAREGHELQQ